MTVILFIITIAIWGLSICLQDECLKDECNQIGHWMEILVYLLALVDIILLLVI